MARPVLRAHVLLLVIASLAAFAAGCDALLSLGSYHERDDATDVDAFDGGVDTSDDASEVEDTEPPPPITEWATPNSAKWKVTADGTSITSYGAEAQNHPVIVPYPNLDPGSDDYRVSAKIFAPNSGEFGVLIRVQPDGSAIAYSSQFGLDNTGTLADLKPPDWGVLVLTKGAKVKLVDGHHYWFKLEVRGKAAYAKHWDDADPEPPGWQAVFAPVPYLKGRGTGFYTYLTNASVLEQLWVTPL